ncbi:MAG TPA: T9SS type A sorting domain-containing protein [Petrimonas sp.]|uniref:right-handed parallel beta-helix repeat-containing protein n=1 Tax=Petrimonas sp. TaxID=2023866 RepID=UPI0017559923|nr:right-handed parallel beta-helix repeat-containing protein [Petrimonas sp.]MEA5046289.1 right-handed parallel beta-helix repeat-containing protein [Petrimonas sp.]HHV87138.1 T9SS type A sorting domain-containing protein [Petrimonas sp.]
MKKSLKIIALNIMFLCFAAHLSYGQGSRYTGAYIKAPAIQHVGKSNFVIEGLEFSNSEKDIIALYSCENVVIKNNKFSSSSKRGIYLDNCKNITIIDNWFENVHTALTAHNSQGVRFDYNDVKNVGGLLKNSNDTNNGFVVLFDRVNGAGNSVSYNVSENIFGESSPGDLINVNQSNGTPQSPITVKGNWIRGGGPSPSGGGIILGDIGGSYQIAEDNILVDPGQYGIAVAGGNNITLRNNKVYGKKNYFTNVAIIGCNWYEEQLGKSFNITIANNSVNFTNKDGYSKNSWWIYKNIEPVAGIETNRDDPTLSPAILPEQIIGRARITTEPKPGEKPDEVVVPDPSISIYKDTFDRICANCKGLISSSATISVLNQNGQKILSIPVIGYHTTIDRTIPSGTYIVKVESDDRLQIKQIVIK